jgi:hypothetical protein
MDIRAKLQELKDMYEKGLITAAVYEQQQQTLLADTGSAGGTRGATRDRPAADSSSGLDAVLDPRKNLAALRRMIIVGVAVLAGIWFIYSFAGRQTKDSIRQFASETGIGKQVIPWTDRADTAARKLIDWNKDKIATAIQGITHPTGTHPSMRGYSVSKLPTGILVEMSVAWKGGVLGGDYSTTVVWELAEKSEGHARVTFDSAMAQVQPRNAELLEEYFRTKVYPVFVSDTGGG